MAERKCERKRVGGERGRERERERRKAKSPGAWNLQWVNPYRYHCLLTHSVTCCTYSHTNNTVICAHTHTSSHTHTPSHTPSHTHPHAHTLTHSHTQYRRMWLTWAATAWDWSSTSAPNRYTESTIQGTQSFRLVYIYIYIMILRSVMLLIFLIDTVPL